MTPAPTFDSTLPPSASPQVEFISQELAHRHATGQRSPLQAEHLGNYGPRYSEYATAAGALA